jgi:hypothetical protein
LSRVSAGRAGRIRRSGCLLRNLRLSDYWNHRLLLHFAGDRGYDVAQFTSSACPPLIGYSLPERPFCKCVNDGCPVTNRPSAARCRHSRRDLGACGAGLTRRLAAHGRAPQGDEHCQDRADGATAELAGCWLVGERARLLRTTHEVLPVRTFYRSTDTSTRERGALLQQLSHELAIDYISVRNVFCNESGCLSRIGPNDSELTAFDPGHLTVPGAIFLTAQTIDGILDTVTPPRYSGSTGTPR